jgi:thioredoxin-like negative regulator of GroEL
MNPPTASSLQSTLDRLRRAVAHEPSKAGHRIDLARCLLSLGRRGEAIAALNTARTVAGDEARAWAVIGTLWSNAGEQRAALEAYDRALTLAPSDPQILFNRATVRRYVGDLEGAEKDYDDAIEGRPSDFEAYLNRSDLRAQTSDRNHIAQLRSLASRPRQDWGSEVQLRFALAKEYEDLGEFAKSFEQLQHGAKLRRQHMQYDLERDLATVDWIIDAYPASAPVPKSASAPPGDDDPIFIVGLPRSGTTLVERILGCHSTLSSAGELDEFALVLMHAAQQRAGRQHLERHELVAISATRRPRPIHRQDAAQLPLLRSNSPSVAASPNRAPHAPSHGGVLRDV